MRRLSVVVVLLLVAGCAGGNGGKSDLRVAHREIRTAKRFHVFPLYWAGERFEQWDVSRILLPPAEGEFATVIYGDCTPAGGDEPSCVPPLEIQIMPLCRHLDVVARAPIWRRRQVRGAPVGTIDSAPVLFSRRVQIKVYRGEGTKPGIEFRVLRALRSLNQVRPVLAATGPIPAAKPAVLDGSAACSG